MLDPKPVFYICGMLLVTLAAVMLVPALVDGVQGDRGWQSFVKAAAVTLFVGAGLMVLTRAKTVRLNLRQAFAFTSISWLLIAAFAALPFVFSSKLNISVTDAFFESMSGITTTGSTVIPDLEIVSRGILLWRSLLQWLGGIGIIVVALAFLPILRVGGMQMFKVEAFDTPEKVLPGAAQIAANIGGAYILLTAVIAIALWAVGMPAFDALNHAMTSIATGGYSTKTESVGHFANASVDWIIIASMTVGSMPFVFLVYALRGNWRPLVRDSQVRVFLAILVTATCAVSLWLWRVDKMAVDVALTQSAFNIVSIMTGTGYATADFNLWGGLPLVVIMTLMFVGGCAGSTSCGIKVFRFQVAYAVARIQILRLLQPHGVFIPYYNKRPIPEDVTNSVMGFFFLFVVSFAILTFLLGAFGLEFITAISGAAAAIANVGPGLGPVIGPEGNFSTLPDAAKWVLSVGMLLGRLELFTVLVLFVPSFWRT